MLTKKKKILTRQCLLNIDQLGMILKKICKSHISKSIMIHRYTDSDKNKPLQLKNQSKLAR